MRVSFKVDLSIVERIKEGQNVSNIPEQILRLS
jgi:hypothetical protein